MSDDRTLSLSDKQRLLLALEEMKAKLRAAEQARREPIAVVGMGCRFPGGAGSPAAFWRLLQGGVDAVRPVPADRWDADAWYHPDPDAPGKAYVRAGGFLDDVRGFDAGFFGIAPREARSLDPQQRLLLEVAWEALEHAGIAPERLAGSQTGVFVGIMNHDYSRHLMDVDRPERMDAHVGSGVDASFPAGRLSYVLGAHGPSMVVATACSSALVSAHLACQSLRTGESDLALAGGVSLMLSPDTNVVLSRMHAVSPDGRCKTFSAAADGYGRGEGCGVVVLKRLSDALRDGDRVLAVIRGSAVNHDGPSGGVTVPNAAAQQAVLRRALAGARVRPAEVGYVEAHGTGTPLGDPIELRALAAVMGEGRPADAPLAVGSVKTNVGHTEAAAGAAGLIKAVLALQHGEIPPHLHLGERNPHVDWDALPITIPTERTPWPQNGRRRIAGVSSFGLSGTNAHVVLEEAPVSDEPTVDPARPPFVLPLSAKSEEALAALVGRMEAHLGEHPEQDAADVCFTAATGRSHFAHRLALVGSDAEELRGCLAEHRAGGDPVGLYRGLAAATRPKVAFLFTGQGAQYVGMGRELYESEPVFRTALDRCDEILRGELERPLLSVLFPAEGEESPLDRTAYTQPALFALEYALVQLWKSRGVEPTFVAGHSVGEYVAACVAGVLSLDNALKLIAARGRLMDALPEGGAMAALFAEEARVRALVEPRSDRVSVAAVNGPTETVISGEAEAVEDIVSLLATEGVEHRRLVVSHAFHSPLLEPMLDEFERVASSVEYREPTLGLVSNVTGRLAEGDELRSGGYWRRHTREAVRFADTVQTLWDLGARVFVEVGPSATLLGMGRRIAPEGEDAWAPSLRKGKNERETFASAVASVWTAGVAVEWEAVLGNRRRVELPTYPFQRRPYWVDRPRMAAAAADPLEDVFHRLVWRETPRPAAVSDLSGRWIVLAGRGRGGVGEALAARLHAAGGECVLVDPADPAAVRDAITEAAGGAPVRGVVHLGALDGPATEEQDGGALLVAATALCAGAAAAAQAVASGELGEGARLWIATRGAQPPVDGDDAAPAQATLWGVARVMALEHPERWGGFVDLDPDASSDDAADALLAELAAADGERQVSLRGGRRHAARLVRAPVADAGPLPVSTEGTYLVTGGTRGLGLETARLLVERGARSLVLVSRGGATPETAERIAALEARGARVLVARGDVASEEDVARILAEAAAALPPLRGVVHAAGVLDDAALARQDAARFGRVLAPKAAGAWNLHRHTAGLVLDFFVLFSSGASLLGTPGQANYAAANAFLDALAHHRRARGLPALSVQWGPWAEVGMAAGGEADLAGRGVGALAPAEGTAALERLMASGAGEAAVLRAEWPRFAAHFPFGPGPSLLSELLPSDAETADTEEAAPPAEPELLRRLRAAGAGERAELLEAHVAAEVARVLGLGGELPDPRQGFFDLGMDSLMAVELRGRLGAALGRTLPTSTVFNYPTVHALARFLAEGLPGAGQPRGGGPAPGAEPAVEDLGNLSDDQLMALLAGELENGDQP